MGSVGAMVVISSTGVSDPILMTDSDEDNSLEGSGVGVNVGSGDVNCLGMGNLSGVVKGVGFWNLLRLKVYKRFELYRGNEHTCSYFP